MAQPPTTPYLAREFVRLLPSLTQKVFRSAAAGAAETFIWEFDLGARITDPSQFLTPPPAAAVAGPANSSTTVMGGAGPQTTPQPAIGPLLDAFVLTTGAAGGSLLVEYAADASPCNYRAMATTAVAASTASNISGLRVTARFVRLTFTNTTAGAIVEVGYYIRNQ